MSGMELLKAVKTANNVSYLMRDSLGFRGTRIGKDSNKYIVYLVFDSKHKHHINHSVKVRQLPESIDEVSIQLSFE